MFLYLQTVKSPYDSRSKSSDTKRGSRKALPFAPTFFNILPPLLFLILKKHFA